ncbi:hypothetical protein C2E20_1409 [Micractinium conductrix]|uniref:Uncharacterized protein n=1 Tax=Micractinium conductrix TaxID=554055 RepID=A0A2P6VNF4_9CHLO|nr:hypothetical protein C2E20_1409 [Micractinium conductrix]|eukprot:PSC75609.1 hypothetical protein C2E20_1409 [Micractinium conductrix]
MADNSVTEFELAVLVLGYLQQCGFAKTASRFKGEARPLFRAAGGTAPPPGVRNLRDLLNDYVRFKETEKRRAALAACNPLAGRIFELLDREAPTAQAAVAAAAGAQQAAAQQAAAAAAANAQWLQMQQQQLQQQMHMQAAVQQQQQAVYAGFPAGQAAGLAEEEGLNGGEGMEHDAYAQAPQQQQQQLGNGGAAHAVTPGRYRKGAPRKRRRAGDGATAAVAPAFPKVALFPGVNEAGGIDAGWGGPMDLLNLPMDASGLELLLDDGPLQLAFAEHLAQHINTTALTAHPPSTAAADQPAGGGRAGGAAGDAGADGSADSGGYLAELMADPHMVLADLPADPRMAELAAHRSQTELAAHRSQTEKA